MEFVNDTTQQTFARANLLRTCRLCCGLVVDFMRGNWCNGFWPLYSMPGHGTSAIVVAPLSDCKRQWAKKTAPPFYCTVLHRSISVATVYRYRSLAGRRQLRSSVSGTLDSQWTRTVFLVVARSECAALRRGTPCRQNCVLLLCVLTLSANN